MGTCLFPRHNDFPVSLLLACSDITLGGKTTYCHSEKNFFLLLATSYKIIIYDTGTKIRAYDCLPHKTSGWIAGLDVKLAGWLGMDAQWFTTDCWSSCHRAGVMGSNVFAFATSVYIYSDLDKGRST